MLMTASMLIAPIAYMGTSVQTVYASESQYLSDYNLHVLTNMISGVESYHQTYSDERNWSSFAEAYDNTSNEVSITLGWAQNYGEEGRKLLQMIQAEYPDTFARLDSAGIAEDITRSWTSYPYYQISRTSAKAQVIVSIISSEEGKKVQDELFGQLMDKYLKNAVDFGIPTDNPIALCFWCEIEHLGGLNPVKRIFTRCNGDYSKDNIMSSLKQDQYDGASDQQVGDSIFWSRHQCIYKWCDYLDMSSSINTCYGYGSQGDDVKDIQIKLDILGFECGSADGDYGNATVSAVSSFQAAYGLEQDGVCGQNTLSALNDAYSSRPSAQGSGFLEQFMNALQDVTDTAREHDYIYGDSASTPPTSDYTISCDRMIAKALYNMSDEFRDQQNGGMTIFTEDDYLTSHGFRRISDPSEVQAGDIVLMTGAGTPVHTFVVVSYDKNTGICSKYDCGSKARIDTQQPFTDVPLLQWSNLQFGCAYRYKTVADEQDNTPIPSPSISNNIMEGQKWLNSYYPNTVTKAVGSLLDVDGSYGTLSRDAALGVWKDLVDRKYGYSLSVSNHNFGDTCREAAANATISEGDTGTLTLVLQFILSAKGYYSGNMDTEFGNGTLAAVIAFQSATGLSPDGAVGQATWDMLFNG